MSPQGEPGEHASGRTRSDRLYSPCLLSQAAASSCEQLRDKIMEKLFEEAAQSADVLDTAQNNTLSAQPDAGAQSAAAFAQNNTLSAQPDAGAQSAAVFRTAPFQVAQSTDLFYTEKKSAQPDAGAQSAAAQNNFPVAQQTDPPYTAPRVSQAPNAQELGSQFSKLTIDSLTRAPRKTTAAQELEIAARESKHDPVPADVARKLSESFSKATSPRGKPPRSPRPEIMEEQEQNCLEISNIVSELSDRAEKLEYEKKRIASERDEAVNKFDQLRMTLNHLELFAEDTVRENKAQQEMIAET